jgi:NAD-dependent DNA ligase
LPEFFFFQSSSIEKIKKQLEDLGARVLDRISPKVSLVITEAGRKSGIQKALSRNEIVAVGSAWVEQCFKEGKVCSSCCVADSSSSHSKYK